MGIGDKLRQTSKGQLNYERKWPEDGKAAKALLDEWTSPPKLSPSCNFFTSPVIAKEISKARAESNRCHGNQGFSVTDGIIHMKTSTPNSALKDDSLTTEKSPSLVERSSADRRIVVLSTQNDSFSNLSMSPDYGRSELALREYEIMWEKKAQDAVVRRRETFEEESRKLETDLQDRLIKLEINEHKKWENFQRSAEDQIREQNQEILRNLKILKDHHCNRKKFLDDVVKSVEGKKVQLEEEAKQQKLEAQKRFQTLTKIHASLKKTQEDLSTVYRSCQYKELLPEPAKKLEELLSQLKNKGDSVLRQASSTQATIDHIHKLHEVFQQAQNALEYLSSLVEEAEKTGEKLKEQQQQQQLQQQQQQQQQQESAATSVPTTTATPPTVTSPTDASSSQPRERDPSLSEVAQVAPEAAFEHYAKLQQQLQQVEQSIEELGKNPQLKQYKFDLQKSVNTPVNAISPVSGEHLRDKLLRLVKLLGGHSVEVGTKKICAKDHPQGILFCKNLLARMIVKKADEQVSSIHESAFAIAMVAVGVWAEHPDLGELILAHFHAACPYLVPYYVPQLEGQSSDDHLKAQGYKFVNGAVEKQDKFLKRMSGVMRLYTAIMVSSPPRTQSTHPYGIEHAWVWLTNVMNMNPHPDITATLIFDLLEVTGHALFRTYNKQFQKLIHHLLTVYMPKIQTVVLSGGPVARLKNFLETCVKRSGNIPPPEGLLGRNFWYT